MGGEKKARPAAREVAPSVDELRELARAAAGEIADVDMAALCELIRAAASDCAGAAMAVRRGADLAGAAHVITGASATLTVSIPGDGARALVSVRALLARWVVDEGIAAQEAMPADVSNERVMKHALLRALRTASERCRQFADDVLAGRERVFVVDDARTEREGAGQLRFREATRDEDGELFAWLVRCRAGHAVWIDGRTNQVPDDAESWLQALHVRPDWPASPVQADASPAAAAGWPWGDYSTSDLDLLAAAVREFWVPWRGDPADAPKNDAVVGFLVERGVAKSKAEVMASLIRSSDVPVGARPARQRK